MSDLISRQAAIDALNELKIYRPLDSDRWVISDCLNKIVNLPSAERHGRWIEASAHDPCDYRCAECGWLSDDEYHYCPNCGAEMVNEDD